VAVAVVVVFKAVVGELVGLELELGFQFLPELLIP
jgi:hypothetical protein